MRTLVPETKKSLENVSVVFKQPFSKKSHSCQVPKFWQAFDQLSLGLHTQERSASGPGAWYPWDA